MNPLGALLLFAHKIIYLAIALFGIGFLIGFHELGHFLFCKLFGIRTPSFSIGFGPQLFSRKIGDTQFIISAIPLGGFVEIAGAAEMGQGKQAHAESKQQDSFAVKPYYQKFLVMMGGILCNLVFAYFAFMIIAFTGIPKTPLMYPTNANSVVKHVAPESAAEQAGITAGDTITEQNGSPLVSSSNTPILGNIQAFLKKLQQSPGEKIDLAIKQGDTLKNISVTLNSRKQNGKTIGTLGVVFESIATPGRSFFEAIAYGIRLTNDWITRTIQGFISIFRQADFKNVGGPVVIISMLTDGATTSFKIFLILLAIISINLAILNLIPLPILDGGQLLFYTIEAIMGRQLPLKVREYIHLATWLLMLGLLLYLSVHDIARIASPYIEQIKQFIGLGR